MPDKNLELAYDAVLQALSQQEVSLGNLRNRATGLLSAAALVTSFAAGLGLINTDPEKGKVFPTWAGLALLGILIVIGILTMMILWPVNYHHGADAKQLIEQRNQGKDEDQVREYMIEKLIIGSDANISIIKSLSNYYRWAIVLLLLEVLVLVLTLAV